MSVDEGAEEGKASTAEDGEAAGEGQEGKEGAVRKWKDWKERAARKWKDKVRSVMEALDRLVNNPRFSVGVLRFVFCSSVLLALIVLLWSVLSVIPTDADSSRYMLSALVQSEAAILAIVITLSLVAVQLTASSFSPRAIEFFRKSPVLWLLLLSYIVAIVSSLVVLDRIPDDYSTAELSVHRYVVLAYFVGALCIGALVPYMLSVFHLLKPSTIIKGLAEDITKEKLLNKDGEDVLQPIVDICASSMQRYDAETARQGLGAIGDRVGKALHEMGGEHPSEKDKKESLEIAESVCPHLVRLGRVAVRVEDDDCAVEVISNIEKVGVAAAEKGLRMTASFEVDAIGDVGKQSVESGLAEAAGKAAEALGEVGVAVVWGLEAEIWSKDKGGIRSEKTELLLSSLIIDSLKQIQKQAYDKNLFVFNIVADVAKQAIEQIQKARTAHSNKDA